MARERTVPRGYPADLSVIPTRVPHHYLNPAHKKGPNHRGSGP